MTEASLNLMQIYKAIVAARNNVPGARNGPSVEMKGILNYYDTYYLRHFCVL